MNIQNSADVKNRIKIRSILIAISIYLVASMLSVGFFLLIALVAITISIFILNKEIRYVELNSSEFKKTLPFRYFGKSFGDFQHVFYHQNNLENEILSTVEKNLKLRTPIQNLEKIELVDVDKNLTNSEKRDFLIADSGTTKRGTSITLVIKSSSFGKMQSFRWWVLVGGYIDKDKRFNLIAYSPFSILFWIIPYIKKEYDILSRVRTIYSAYYNDIDVMTQIRCLHEAVFDAMVEELEKNNIDTSDIKAQKMQVMNINISGGKVNMGNIVQGAMNKVAAKVVGGN